MPITLFRTTLTILLVALLTGLVFAHVLELPAKMHYEAAMYIAVQKSLYVRGAHQMLVAYSSQLRFSRLHLWHSLDGTTNVVYGCLWVR